MMERARHTLSGFLIGWATSVVGLVLGLLL